MAALTYGAVPVGAFLAGTLATWLGAWGAGTGLAITLLLASAIGLEAPIWIASAGRLPAYRTLA